VTVLALAIAAGLSGHAELLWERRWSPWFLLAGLPFGAGLAFRHQRWPSALTWLGLISYSVYLLHPLVVEVYYHFTWTRQHHPLGEQVLLAAGILAIVIALSSATYVLVERPAQNLGRRRAAGWTPPSAPTGCRTRFP
jgi:peptidoglycan/LPS O-acetylase OafA/YrhL